jgi:MFS family permease
MLRIAAARGELWLDEIWTIQGVQAAHSPADIVLSLKHDNNHFLNSFMVYLIGPDGAAWMNRCPAVIAGSLTVLLAGWIQRRRGSATTLAALGLCGFSFLLVNYSSEARGYAYEMFFALAAFGILCQMKEVPSLGWECVFAATCILGFLAHPLFLNVYLAAQVWTLFSFHRRLGMDKRARPRLAAILFRTVIPGLFFGWLYWVNLSQMSIGGGDAQPYFNVIAQTMSLAVGGPFNAPFAYLAAAVMALFTVAAFWSAFRQSPQRAAFYFCVTLIFPALLLVLAPRKDIYPRYFLISVLFLLMLWSDYVGDVCRRYARGKLFVTLALATWVLANGWHIAQLIRLERGHYQAAIELMRQDTLGSQVAVLMDHPFRQGTILDYYGQRMPAGKPFRAVTAAVDAEWYLVHDLNVDFVPSNTIVEDGITFRLVKHYPFAGLSGWHLCLYQRESAAR